MSDEEQARILFQEPDSSGRSLKNWLTRISGAAGCLSIVVTEEELLLESNLRAITGMFSRTPEISLREFEQRLDEQGDLRHRIPQQDIISVTVKPRWWGAKTFLLEFKDAAGVINRIELNPKRDEEFERALQIPVRTV